MMRVILAGLLGVAASAILNPSVVAAQTGTVLSAEPVQAAFAWNETPIVQVTLRSASGVPLADQTIFATVGDDRRQSRTGADGRTAVSFSRGLPPAEHVAVIEFPGTPEFAGSQISVAFTVRQPTLTIETAPAVEGMEFSYLDQQFVTGADGRTTIPVALVDHRLPQLEELDLIPLDADLAPRVRATFVKWYGRPPLLKASVQLHYRVGLTISDLEGRALDPDVVSSVTIRNSIGETFTITDISQPIWFKGNRVVAFGAGLESTDLYYTIESVMVAGNNVVNRAQQLFRPSETQDWDIRLLFYSARIEVRDAIFKFPIGDSVSLEQPNGEILSLPLDGEGRVEAAALPRGNYTMTVNGPGFSFSRPLALSKNQEVHLAFLSFLDVGVGIALVLSVTLGLLFAGRPYLLRGGSMRGSANSGSRRVSGSAGRRLPSGLRPRSAAAYFEERQAREAAEQAAGVQDRLEQPLVDAVPGRDVLRES